MGTFDDLRGSDNGTTVHVVGSGKTMDYIDPGYFADKYVIGVNYSAVALPLDFAWHVSNHHDDAEKIATMKPGHVVITSEVEQVPAADSTGIPATSSNVLKVPTTDQRFAGFDPVADWSESRLMLGPSSATLAMSLAWWLGADTIILCGIDCGAIDGNGRFDGYEVPDGQLVYGVWQKALDDMANAIRARGVGVYSMNPWTTLALEGHRFHGA
ncbi:MAG TPA: hypothetical protein VLA24_11535 [Pseudomonadales bacterium]|nr:hypothetical protein [Pseudomonadales bacterium]